jgi:hypothetical protein
VGPAGVGKSTTALRVRQQLESEGVAVSVLEPNQLGLLRILLNVRVPLRLWRLGRALILHRRSLTAAGFALRKLGAAVCVLSVARGWHGDVVLLGEGLFQKLRTARRRIVNQSVLDLENAAVFTGIPFPDVCVYLLAGPDADVSTLRDLQWASRLYGVEIWPVAANPQAAVGIADHIRGRLAMNRSREVR